MAQHEVVFQKSFGDWVLSIFMLLLPLSLFWFFYPRSGFENGNKGLIYLMFIALSLFLYGFYRTFLVPYRLQFQNGGILAINSLLFPKVVAISEIQSVQITEKGGGKSSVQAIYTILLKDGEPIELPFLTKMDYFVEKLKTQNPQIEIKDERSHKKVS